MDVYGIQITPRQLYSATLWPPMVMANNAGPVFLHSWKASMYFHQALEMQQYQRQIGAAATHNNKYISD